MTNELSEAIYQRACSVLEIADDQPLGLEIGGEPVVIVRTQGEYFALRDACSHAEVALSDGEVDSGCSIECWLHGSRFDLRTGKPLELPATEPVRTYPIKVDGDDVLVAVAPSQ